MTIEPKTLDESPKTSDTILLEISTTDSDGNLVDPYKVNQIIIYYLAREFNREKTIALEDEIELPDSEIIDLTTYYNKAQVAKVFGNADDPLWLSTDPDASVATKVDTGQFKVTWVPEFAREGDYILCWLWTPLMAGDTLKNSLNFHLDADTSVTTTLPDHRTDPAKYPTLLERYLPEYLKLQLGDGDLTPTVVETMNQAIADGFVILEDMTNSSADLLDANAIHERLLLYLSNLFNLKLRSNDVTLWRRQTKRAVPMFKKKGTLSGLSEALEQAGISFNGLTQYWQVVSPYTWQEAFTVTDDQTEFELAKTPYYTTDFDLYLRPNGSDTYTTLTAHSYAEITYDTDDVLYILKWIGDTAPTPIELADGDIVRVIYQVAPIDDITVENYIRSLPLSDQRDEAEITYPLKNWNVHLIEETDTMFDVICPTRHPMQPDVVWGQLRTEFPFSENIYNMEEYNGSLRDSTDPCDMDKAFLDECSCGISSKISVDVEIEELSDVRLEEAAEIIDEYKPFHAVLHALSYEGAINEVMVPQQEEVEILVQFTPEDVMTNGQDVFSRTIKHGLLDYAAVRRNVLALAGTPVSGTGMGTNDTIVLYSPGVRFDVTISGLDTTNNLLEILSGPDIGEYKVTNPGKNAVDIVQGFPDTIGWPLNTSGFPFRLSNELFSGSIVSIDEDNVFAFTDENTDFRFSDVEPGWKIEVTAPAGVIGTYTILDSFPDDSLSLSSWGDLQDRTGITYQLQTDTGTPVGDPSSTGQIHVGRRAKVNGGTDFRTRYGVEVGDYLLVGGVQYPIREFIDDENFYITDGWTFGSVGVTAANVYRRLLDNAVGYLDVRGMTLDTSPTDYETTLSISNGTNALGPLLENSQFKENFLVLIDGKYHQIVEIDADEVTLSGPTKSWGLAGTAVSFDIVQFTKQSVTIHGDTLSFVDRRNNDRVEIENETRTPMSVIAHFLNHKSDENVEVQSQQEGVTIEIDWKD